MSKRLSSLVTQARGLPHLHVVMSFFVATLLGLTVVGAMTHSSQGSTGDKSAGSADATGGRPKSRSREVPPAMQQLTVMPIRVGERSDWQSAKRQIAAGRVGGVLLAGTPSPSLGVRAQVEKLKTASTRPTALLVLAAPEGYPGETCSALFPGLPAAMDQALAGNPGDLVQGLSDIGANGLVAVSIKDQGTGCGGGGGRVPAGLAAALKGEGILYVPRGASIRGKDAQQRLPWPAYRKAIRDGVRLVAASATPLEHGALTPTWLDPSDIAEMHKRGVAVATPDLSSIIASGAVPTESGPRTVAAAVGQALDSGIDLPLLSSPGAAAGRQAARNWWREHTTDLAHSCAKLRAAKRSVLGKDAVQGVSCATAGS